MEDFRLHPAWNPMPCEENILWPSEDLSISGYVPLTPDVTPHHRDSDSSVLIAQNDPFLWSAADYWLLPSSGQPLAHPGNEDGATESHSNVEGAVGDSPPLEHLYDPEWSSPRHEDVQEGLSPTESVSNFSGSEISDLETSGFDVPSPVWRSDGTDVPDDVETTQPVSPIRRLRRSSRLPRRTERLCTEGRRSLDLDTECNASPEAVHSEYFSPVQTMDDPLTRIQSTTRSRDRGPKSWEFLVRLLKDSSSNPALVCWEDKERFTFRIKQPRIVAQMWGRRVNKQITYENFARSLRYHYGKGGLEDVREQKLVYGLGERGIAFLKRLCSH
ncbi:ETS-related transcription factor Elf-3-like isoform X2 [Macrobrachium nipponense]|uniref:ETS-related transcription factor Elf-3-like isoform X2 n=1 Tax=Macrobrachium nipponense TaxID=159736 RepID=UPI0030C86A52